MGAITRTARYGTSSAQAWGANRDAAVATPLERAKILDRPGLRQGDCRNTTSTVSRSPSPGTPEGGSPETAEGEGLINIDSYCARNPLDGDGGVD